jgi:hypothetical protein
MAAARTHGRCQARSTLGVLEAVPKFLPENTTSARSASINWRLIVTFGSSVVHLRITLDP